MCEWPFGEFTRVHCNVLGSVNLGSFAALLRTKCFTKIFSLHEDFDVIDDLDTN